MSSSENIQREIFKVLSLESWLRLSKSLNDCDNHARVWVLRAPDEESIEVRIQTGEEFYKFKVLSREPQSTSTALLFLNGKLKGSYLIKKKGAEEESFNVNDKGAD